jgi:hypothetical protein
MTCAPPRTDPKRTQKVKGFATKQDVLEEVNRLAEKLRAQDPNLTLAQARTKVWEQHPELARKYKELGGVPGTAQSAPKKPPVKANTVRKGQSLIDRATQEAREIQKNNPGMSLHAARAKVWEDNPDLAA